ncbi:MaoC family dehydratase [Kitasatospora kifunensis]|uniref:Acyl dehydratase n=1 Tax=Kitasatospora kifunensis TaxID=58351 RepID=A0A7W7VW61_KITKI|nr:MaoC family dehydratase [Kitasatospora kifunensis]MBB4924598.1 acyl dehydratase [Kitasatospora kifunensis]
MRVFPTLEAFTAAQGSVLGSSDWRTVTQQRVDAFAQATDDHQWIHTDPARAVDGPFGTTVAHGYLTLSLLPALCAEIYRIDGAAAGVNYGLDTVRFPGPVPVGSRIRGVAELLETVDTGRGLRARVRVTVEVDGQARPGCVAESIALFLPPS